MTIYVKEAEGGGFEVVAGQLRLNVMLEVQGKAWVQNLTTGEQLEVHEVGGRLMALTLGASAAVQLAAVRKRPIMTPPTLKQMRARMNSGHRQVLEAVRDGRKLSAGRMSDARGLMTCRSTLVMWGAIEGEGLTEVGRQLLAEQVA